jgi:hypothetical protein
MYYSLQNYKFIKIIFVILSFNLLGAAPANSEKYCNAIKQITPGLDVYQVMALLGIPTNFSIPANINIAEITGKNFNTKPASNLNTKDVDIAGLKKHPIFGAFASTTDEQTNTLSWVFEKNTVLINVRLQGPKVSKITTNLECK